MIIIIDYGIGNLRAISNMLSRLGIKNLISRSKEDIKAASGIILPGNGHYDACLKAFRSFEILPEIEKAVLMNNVPFLGICVGAQMLGHTSEEGQEIGLGWLDMDVKKLPATSDFKVPNMGWRYVEQTHRHANSEGLIKLDSRFYFTHSYYMRPNDDAITFLESDHGFRFAAAVRKDNIIGVQFHPEKSHGFGKYFLSSFEGICK